MKGSENMSKFVPERRYGWRLTGDEILLDLTAEDGKRGIYALNPFETEPKPKLLIRGGMRPVWNHRRTLFAYYRTWSCGMTPIWW